MKFDGKSRSDEGTNKGAIEACVEWLMDNEFISIQKEGDGTDTIAQVLFYYVPCHDGNRIRLTLW